MSDVSVRAALRSDASLVLVEAPAGCGKTHQGAEYARHLAATDPASRPLILTHTHAACSVFAERTEGNRVDIRTIDSVVAQVASAYHLGLGLPADTSAWVRQQPKDGYGELCLKVARLLKRHPFIARSIAQRHRTVICDEHQDATGDQHAILSALLDHGARLRIFADPMQRIFKDKLLKGSSPPWNWEALKGVAGTVDELDHPYRWEDGCTELGGWTLSARNALKAGGTIDLRKGVPSSVEIVFAENLAKDKWGYRLEKETAQRIYRFERKQTTRLLILTHHNPTARALCAFFGRRVPLWEGHMRTGLEKLVMTMTDKHGDRDAIAAAVVRFMDDTSKGFSASAFGDRFQQEVREGCATPTKGKPGRIQELARFLVCEPDHRGVGKMLRRLAALKDTDPGFAEIKTDCHREFWDAVRIGEFETADAGFTEITHRRSHIRPKPPTKAISTIHKAKGLECDVAVVMPCDAKTFPDKMDARCLLYVAISRAKKRLMLVASRDNPSPLLTI